MKNFEIILQSSKMIGSGLATFCFGLIWNYFLFYQVCFFFVFSILAFFWAKLLFVFFIKNVLFFLYLSISLLFIINIFLASNLMQTWLVLPKLAFYFDYISCLIVELFFFSKWFKLCCYVALLLVINVINCHLSSAMFLCTGGEGNVPPSNSQFNNNSGLPNLPDGGNNGAAVVTTVGEKKECCFGEDNSSVSAMPFVSCNNGGEPTHIELAKIVDVQDRHINHAKFVPVPYSILQLPQHVQQMLLEAVVPYSEWDHDKQESLFVEDVKTNFLKAQNAQNSNYIDRMWLNKIHDFLDDLKAGLYSKMKQNPFVVVRDGFLFNPAIAELYKDLSLVETKRVFFPDPNVILRGFFSLHNHTATEASFFCKASDSSMSQFRFFQFLSSSSFRGENTCISNENYEGLASAQFLTNMFCVGNDETHNSNVIAVPHEKVALFLHKNVFTVKQCMQQAWVSGPRYLTSVTQKVLLNSPKVPI